jgi:hypothetical protein
MSGDLRPKNNERKKVKNKSMKTGGRTCLMKTKAEQKTKIRKYSILKIGL